MVAVLAVVGLLLVAQPYLSVVSTIFTLTLNVPKVIEGAHDEFVKHFPHHSRKPTHKA
jgi:hypothetical protein